MIIYKGLSKAELAQDANITPAQLRKWLAECKHYMDELHISPKTKILPPAAVGILARKYQFMPRNAVVIAD